MIWPRYHGICSAWQIHLNLYVAFDAGFKKFSCAVNVGGKGFFHNYGLKTRQAIKQLGTYIRRSGKNGDFETCWISEFFDCANHLFNAPSTGCHLPSDWGGIDYCGP